MAAAGPFYEKDVNQTDPEGIAPVNGWPLDNARASFSTVSGELILYLHIPIASFGNLNIEKIRN